MSQLVQRRPTLVEEIVNPTALENFAAGFVIFDRWINTVSEEEFVLVGDGNWVSTTSGTGGGFNPIITSPQPKDILQYDGSDWRNYPRYISKVIVRSIADLPTPVGTEINLATDTIYEVDGDLDITGYTLCFGQRTQINGIGQNVSIIRSSTNGVSVADPYVMFKSSTNLFMNSLEIFCEGQNQLVWENISDGSVVEGESFELNRFAVFCFETAGHNNKLGFVKDIRQGFMGTMFFFGFEDGWEFAGTWIDGGFRISNTLFTNCSGKFYYSSATDPVTFQRRFASNAAIQVPAGSIGYDFPETSFIFTGQYQLQNGNASGAGTYVSDFTSGFPAFNKLANFRNNTGIQDTFQGGEWVNTADTVTVINTQNVWERLNVVTINKFLTWFTELNGEFEYEGGNPLDVSILLTLSVTSKANDVVEVRLIKEDALAVTTEILRRAITIQGTTAQGRAESVPIQATDQLLEGDLVYMEIRNTSGSQNITTLSNSNCIIGAK